MTSKNVLGMPGKCKHALRSLSVMLTCLFTSLTCHCRVVEGQGVISQEQVHALNLWPQGTFKPTSSFGSRSPTVQI